MAELPPELVERLYAVPPENFVAARTQAVAETRAAGQAAVAREVARLRKPTVAAWMVNLLAIRRPELVTGLADLADELRRAQRDLRGDQLRELSAQRRAVVGALVGEARQLARREVPGLDPHRLPLAEVEATLNAALADADVATQLRSGRLVKAASYAGFGEVPRPKLRLVTDTGPETVPAARSAAADRAGTDRTVAERTRADRAAADRQRAEQRRRAEADRAEPRRQTEAHRAEERRRAEADRAAQRAEADRAAQRAEADRAAQRERAAQHRRLAAELAEAETERERAQHELTRSAQEEQTAAGKLAEVRAELAGIERQLAELERRQLELERRRTDTEHEVTRWKLARKGAERAAAAAGRRCDEARAALDEV